MSSAHGRFVWYELMTTDPAAAKAFYGKVVGWGTRDVPDMNYTLLMAGDAMAAGLMAMPPEAQGVPPHWMGYVAVDDVDAAARKAEGLGGRVHVAPRDIPGMGRFAVLADPQGAVIALYKGTSEPEPPPMDAPRRIGWHELYASDWEKAFDFYAALFGWRKGEAVPIGEMGTYQLFTAGGADAVGGMFNKPADLPVCFWLYYVGVPDFDAAAARVAAAGGKIVNGPMEVPGGAWIVQGMDPQGAMFALVGQRG